MFYVYRILMTTNSNRRVDGPLLAVNLAWKLRTMLGSLWDVLFWVEIKILLIRFTSPSSSINLVHGQILLKWNEPFNYPSAGCFGVFYKAWRYAIKMMHLLPVFFDYEDCRRILQKDLNFWVKKLIILLFAILRISVQATWTVGNAEIFQQIIIYSCIYLQP